MTKEKSTHLTDKYFARLHLGAREQTHRNAKDLRRRQTEAEEKLWSLLRNRQLKGKKFRRQHALENYVADFYCHEVKLVIELDGGIHEEQEQKEYDLDRTSVLKEYGIKVIRFKNEEVVSNLDVVLDKIKSCLT